MELSNAINIDAIGLDLGLESLAENRIQALKSLTQLMLNELKLLENLKVRKEEFPGGDRVLSLSDEVENFEIELIRMALIRAKGNQRLAARLLTTKISTLNAKIKRYGIEPQGMTAIPASDNRDNNLILLKSLS